jgi:hypothetical protein
MMIICCAIIDISLHGLVLRSIEDDFAGRLRAMAGCGISGANFVPPNANNSLLDELIDFINTNPLRTYDIELAAVFS